ncbi:MAG: hypothetical protein M1816_001941 [Peltula sp. TS41687]|nr:MAG: hypothetical protein M1816_001941 [Peltula sp. TS41687]
MSRPEDTLPAEIYYSPTTSRKYTTSSRIQTIQASMTARALSLLSLRTPSLILDIGCGSGLSGSLLTSAGHAWVGMDISSSMLSVALERDVSGDLLLSDIGQGVPFRAGAFDAAISISAIQWLCNADSSEVSASGRLARFFAGLYRGLKRGARAVCQFYPKNREQRRMVEQAAVKAGFGAGVLEDGPGTKGEKLFLVLTVGGGEGSGGTDITGVVEGLEGVDVVETKGGSGRRERVGKGKGKEKERKGSRRWILRKKEQMERKGMVVKPSSKYTGRKRGPKF